MLAEADNVAQELNLIEGLSLGESNLVTTYISPPRMAQQVGTIGNITTSNYTYYVSVAGRFSYLERSDVHNATTSCSKIIFGR